MSSATDDDSTSEVVEILREQTQIMRDHVAALQELRAEVKALAIRIADMKARVKDGAREGARAGRRDGGR